MGKLAMENAAKLNAIRKAGNSYSVRKYAGAWVPVIVANGVRQTFSHCSTSGGAMGVAITECAKASGWGSEE